MRRVRATTYSPARPPEPLRNYSQFVQFGYSGTPFWAWFDSLTPAERRRLNDYDGLPQGFRDIMDDIVTQQLRKMAERDQLTAAQGYDLLEQSKRDRT